MFHASESITADKAAIAAPVGDVVELTVHGLSVELAAPEPPDRIVASVEAALDESPFAHGRGEPIPIDVNSIEDFERSVPQPVTEADVDRITPLREILLTGLDEDCKVLIDRQPKEGLTLAQIRVAYVFVRSEFEEPDASSTPEERQMIADKNQAMRQAFIDEHFEPPVLPGAEVTPPGPATKPIEEHLEEMWDRLTVDMREDLHTRFGLLHEGVIPGERFNELYYWDGYFTMRGLLEARRTEQAEHMLENCRDQIERFGYVPNGNRDYYLGRSQPSVYAQMIRAVADFKKTQAEANGEDAVSTEVGVYEAYLPTLMKERAYFNRGRQELSDEHVSEEHAVQMPDGSAANRYWDHHDTPRPESMRLDEELADRLGLTDSDRAELFRNVRAGAATGWDFSGRWFADGKNLTTIDTTNKVAIDLNALLHDTDETIAYACGLTGRYELAAQYQTAAAERSAMINTYLWREWSETDAAGNTTEYGTYVDWNIRENEQSDYMSAAGLFALRSGLASEAQAARMARFIEDTLLAEGGLRTSLNTDSKEQWDGNNGWAPLQLVAVEALERYGYNDLAEQIMRRWVKRVEEIYKLTGEMHEKYNVGPEVTFGTGGEYKPQTGFGWSNAVYPVFRKKLANIDAWRQRTATNNGVGALALAVA